MSKEKKPTITEEEGDQTRPAKPYRPEKPLAECTFYEGIRQLLHHGLDLVFDIVEFVTTRGEPHDDGADSVSTKKQRVVKHPDDVEHKVEEGKEVGQVEEEDYE